METQDKWKGRFARECGVGLGKRDLRAPGRGLWRGGGASGGRRGREEAGPWPGRRGLACPEHMWLLTGRLLDLELITPGAFSLLFDLNILSPPASLPLASLLAVYPFPGSSLTPHSSSGARSSLEKPSHLRPRWPRAAPACVSLSPLRHILLPAVSGVSHNCALPFRSPL